MSICLIQRKGGDTEHEKMARLVEAGLIHDVR